MTTNGIQSLLTQMTGRCKGKVEYATKRRAKAHIKYMKRKGAPHAWRLNAYPCNGRNPAFTHWHLTTRKARE